MIEFERHPLVHTARTCISISIQQIRHDYTHLVSLRIKHRVGRRFSLGTNPQGHRTFIGFKTVLDRAGQSRSLTSCCVVRRDYQERRHKRVIHRTLHPRHLAHLCHRRPAARWGLQETGTLSQEEFFLCLSRACLGKTIIFI
jgi:hypothetical protein